MTMPPEDAAVEQLVGDLITAISAPKEKHEEHRYIAVMALIETLASAIAASAKTEAQVEQNALGIVQLFNDSFLSRVSDRRKVMMQNLTRKAVPQGGAVH
jgi:hypothetical protein